MAKILFFGPYSPPVTGQSLAFKTVVDSYSSEQYLLVDTTRFKSSVLNSFYSVLCSVYYLSSQREISVVYFTCTRSVLGSIKDIPLLIISRIKKLRVVNHLHGADFKFFFRNMNKVQKAILGRAYKAIDVSLVLTKSMTSEFDDFPTMKKEIVPNFYPKDFDREILEKNGLIVTFFSNLMKSKGILDFLWACKMIHQERPEITFKIAGEFMSDELMSKKEVSNEVGEFMRSNSGINIEYLGQIDPKNRFKLLEQSSVFVLPTYYKSEGVPLTIIEAMVCGNVIITTNHNYLSDIIRPENGKLIEVRNPCAIKEAVIEFADNISLMKTVQEYNRNEARNKYSEVAYINSLKKIISL